MKLNSSIESSGSVNASASGNFGKQVTISGIAVGDYLSSHYEPMVYCGHNGTTTLSVDNTLQVVPIRNDVIIDGIYSRASDEITVGQSGVYKVVGECSVKPISTAGGARGTPAMRLEVNGNMVNGANSHGYTREGGNGRGANLNVSLIGPLSSGDSVRMRIADTTTNEPAEEVPVHSARLLVELIR